MYNLDWWMMVASLPSLLFQGGSGAERNEQGLNGDPSGALGLDLQRLLAAQRLVFL